ncbi:hypothetical protein M6B38_316955 [Iris pallida]|uniref:Uncharacterized protein n=1 Tax=Iris pallida TaxID=29817 RepID=A0AAX6HF87_IRIPA|nr:hypothetical protein M6B38_316955 [Iris pallida]
MATTATFIRSGDLFLRVDTMIPVVSPVFVVLLLRKYRAVWDMNRQYLTRLNRILTPGKIPSFSGIILLSG